MIKPDPEEKGRMKILNVPSALGKLEADLEEGQGVEIKIHARKVKNKLEILQIEAGIGKYRNCSMYDKFILYRDQKKRDPDGIIEP